MRSCLLLPLTLALFVAIMAFVPTLALAQEQTVVEGQLVNGTAGGPAPAGLEVLLHAIQPNADVETSSAVTDDEGRFRVEVPMVDDTASYVLSLSYQGVVYGRRLDAAELDQPVSFAIYETTSDLDVLEVTSAVFLIRPDPDLERTLNASEVVSLVNTSDRTFTPNLSGQTMGQMNFMRFSLPPGATNLSLESDLAGGDVIDVGPGFAVTSSVPPGDHLLSFSYQAPYDGDSLAFTRTAHIPTADFRVLLPEPLRAQGDGLSLGDPVQLGDTLYQSRLSVPLDSGDRIELQLTDLPQPSWGTRLGDTLLQGALPQLFLVSVLGAALLGALLYSLLRASRSARQPALAPSGQGASHGPLAEDCLRRLAELDDAWERGEAQPEDYQARREALKAELLQAWATEERP